MFKLKKILCLCASCLVIALSTKELHAGAFIFSGEANGIDIVTHPTTYTGTGGNIIVRVCIDPASPNAADMEIPIQNNINVYNKLEPTLHNLKSGANNNVPSNAIDMESVTLHEIGHCLGLAHVNAASESGLSNPNIESTKSTDGVNNIFDVQAGTDGVVGSSDDIRGDDVNLHWFRKFNNDPFSIDSVIDQTTYSVDVADLPAGDNFAANGARAVSALLGNGSDTEAVMQQGTFFDEAQRTLTHDDVATLRYAESGINETAGNNDDYTVTLEYGGISATNCDISVGITTTTGLAFCSVSGTTVGPRNKHHVRVTNATIELGDGFNWFFNTDTVNQAPVLTPVGNQVVTSGQTLNVNLSASDADNDVIVFSVTGLPGFATLADNGNGTGVITILPTNNDVGVYPITITTTDNGLPNLNQNEAITITVNQIDSDGDGLSDFDETNTYFTDPNNPDTDGDGLTDGAEVNTHLTDPNNADSDGDSLTDGDEINVYLTNPNNPDSDGDGLTDDTEVNTTFTNPNNVDSDSDGLTDGVEVNVLLTDPNNADSDGDGLTDGTEVLTTSTNPNNPDSDSDGLTDGDEINIYFTNPNNADSDGDGLTDGAEINTYLTDPNNIDTDGDGFNDGIEVTFGSNPNDANVFPNIADGDLAPLGAPDGVVNSADLLILQRIILGDLLPTTLEYAHGDLFPVGAPDGVINLSDLLLLQKLVTQ